MMRLLTISLFSLIMCCVFSILAVIGALYDCPISAIALYAVCGVWALLMDVSERQHYRDDLLIRYLNQ